MNVALVSLESRETANLKMIRILVNILTMARNHDLSGTLL